ncbi:MAG: PQQ-like beta-propeller repeat protein [Sedimentisphaerales bacterium]|nr:PQQ-like beta-propeller repeat protein [Sedimentisphaerales bacterium]
MKSLNLSKVVMVSCVLLAASGCIFAKDWPQWRGPNRDGEVSGFAAPSKWPSALKQNWKVTVGSGDATPALVGDKLYVFARQGSEEVTLCLQAADGKEIWSDKYEAQAVTGAASRHPGPRSSPAVADGKVVTLGVGGVVSCLDAASGKVFWRKDPYPKIVPKFFTSCSPVIVGGTAVVQVGTAGNGAVIAFNLADGSEKWKWAGEGPEYASPVVLTVDGAEQIVALTEKSIVGVGAADGKLLWSLPFAPAGRAYNAATPIVDGQTVIYTGSGRGAKAVKIEKQGDGFAAKELWSNSALAPQYNTPVLKDGLLFGLSDRGSLYCINAKDGSTAWTDTAQHGRGFAAIVVAGSDLLALPSTSELIVFKPDGKAYSEVAKYKVAETETYAHPVVSDKRVFVKDQDSVAMWTIE